MKVGLLTSHASMNYGGLLQAYALQQSIKNLGYDCKIINYKPNVHDIKKHPFQFLTQRKGFIKKGFLGITNYHELKNRVRIFEAFRQTYFDLSNNSVTDEELPAESEKYDILCVGSDQLWNLNQNDNKNRVYMLDFPHRNKSISYGISFGDGLKKSRKEIIASIPLIQKFSSVSVREKEGQIFLREHEIDSTVVLDPTLMVDTAFWNKFRGKSPLIDESYILVYGFENAFQKYTDLVYAAKKASKNLNIPVINPILTPGLSYAGFRNYYQCGPVEFLNLIENAELIITNSFHGSIFSALFHRPFISITGKNGEIDARKKNLFHLLQMEDRAITPYSDWDANLLRNSAESKIDESIKRERTLSKEFLQNAIQE